jgi:hypothetical protein
MKKTFTLSIPKPCHEKWEEFNPTTLGGFCSSCQKEVVDFTTWGEDRIKTYFKNRSQTSCGRFYPEQLKNYTLDEAPKFNFLRWTYVPLISLVMLLFSRNAQAQKIGKTKIEKVKAGCEATSVNLGTVRTKEITGTVMSDEDLSFLPGVNVVLKGTTIGTVTDAAGEFSITVPDPKPSDTLMFSFIGMVTLEQSVYGVQDLSVKMQNDSTFSFGEVVVVAGMISGVDEEKSEHRGLWWRLKNLFRKN